MTAPGGETVAIIPARGGSKRIPRKNVRPFCGRPMIAWPIDSARRSGVFSRIIVSTDDPGIADTARAAGAEAPFVRPAALSGDHTPVTEAMTHAAGWLAERGELPATLALIYPTAPLLDPDALRRAHERFLTPAGTDYLVSVTSFPFPIDRALVETGECLAFRWPEHRLTRSQDLPECLHDAAQFIFGRSAAWTERRPVFGPGTHGYRLPRWRVQDIDTQEDWERAERIHAGYSL